ncbi:MAG: ABC transporter ATP-binding protein [Desulfobacterales bacterium]
MNPPVIRAEGLTKRYGGVLALDRVSFEVAEGEIFGFLGPNGAGKTTTIHLLTGLARPDGGRVFIHGEETSGRVKRAQHLFGIVADESNLYPELTGFDNLSFCGALYGMRKRAREERARELLGVFGLAEAADRRFSGYSKGMKRRLAIAAALMHRPPILFLDEPTTGIDVASARRIRGLLAELSRGGVTIFLTTHYIEEAERLCRRIAFIASGRLLRVDLLEELLEPLKGRHLLRLTLSREIGDRLGGLTRAFPSIARASLSGKRCLLESSAPVALGPIVRYLEECGIEVLEAVRQRPSLEEVFVEITGIEAEAMRGEKEPRKGGGEA